MVAATSAKTESRSASRTDIATALDARPHRSQARWTGAERSSRPPGRGGRHCDRAHSRALAAGVDDHRHARPRIASGARLLARMARVAGDVSEGRPPENTEALRREWFFEQRNGNCRLMAPFAERLAQTAGTWAQALAPIAERVAKRLWSTVRKGSSVTRGAATRLTQQNRRRKGSASDGDSETRRPPRVCRECGVAIQRGETHCAKCWTRNGSERMRAVAAKGRVVAQTPEAQARSRAFQAARSRNRARGGDISRALAPIPLRH